MTETWNVKLGLHRVVVDFSGIFGICLASVYFRELCKHANMPGNFKALEKDPSDCHLPRPDDFEWTPKTALLSSLVS